MFSSLRALPCHVLYELRALHEQLHSTVCYYRIDDEFKDKYSPHISALADTHTAAIREIDSIAKQRKPADSFEAQYRALILCKAAEDNCDLKQMIKTLRKEAA